jgi:hypothetical protein
MSSNPVLKFLDGVFLWLPNDRSPGVGAVALYLVRQALLTIAVVVAPLIVLMLLAGTSAGKMLNPAAMPPWLGESVVALCFGAFALVQELSRYAFVRHAERPARSLVVFTGVVVVCILIFDHDRLYTPAWMIAWQLATSAVLYFALRRRELIGFVVAGLIACQTLVDVTAPQLFPVKAPAASKATSAPQGTAAASVVPPAVGNMKAWAQLYPGATVTQTKTDKLFGLTTWRVDYQTSASPEEIGAFYQSLAKQQGFTETMGVAGVHIFENPARSRFTYVVATDAGHSDVDFEARADDSGR